MWKALSRITWPISNAVLGREPIGFVRGMGPVSVTASLSTLRPDYRVSFVIFIIKLNTDAFSESQDFFEQQLSITCESD